jgi:hypothetical protein
MFCLPLSEWCARRMNGCFTAEDISWGHRVAMCTDGVAAPTGHRKGSQPEAQQLILAWTLYIVSHMEGLQHRVNLNQNICILCCKVRWKFWTFKARPLNSVL